MKYKMYGVSVITNHVAANYKQLTQSVIVIVIVIVSDAAPRDWWQQLQWTLRIGLVLIDVDALQQQHELARNVPVRCSGPARFRLRGHLIVWPFDNRWDIHVFETATAALTSKLCMFHRIIHSYAESGPGLSRYRLNRQGSPVNSWFVSVSVEVFLGLSDSKTRIWICFFFY